jgi:hypothetical protein
MNVKMARCLSHQTSAKVHGCILRGAGFSMGSNMDQPILRRLGVPPHIGKSNENPSDDRW